MKPNPPPSGQVELLTPENLVTFHPSCKVIPWQRVEQLVKTLRQRGDFVEADTIAGGLLSAMGVTIRS